MAETCSEITPSLSELCCKVGMQKHKTIDTSQLACRKQQKQECFSECSSLLLNLQVGTKMCYGQTDGWTDRKQRSDPPYVV